MSNTANTFKFGQILIGKAYKTKLGIFLDEEKAKEMVVQVYGSYPPDHLKRLMPVEIFVLHDANTPNVYIT